MRIDHKWLPNCLWLRSLSGTSILNVMYGELLILRAREGAHKRRLKLRKSHPGNRNAGYVLIGLNQDFVLNQNYLINFSFPETSDKPKAVQTKTLFSSNWNNFNATCSIPQTSFHFPTSQLFPYISIISHHFSYFPTTQLLYFPTTLSFPYNLCISI